MAIRAADGANNPASQILSSGFSLIGALISACICAIRVGDTKIFTVHPDYDGKRMQFFSK